MNISAYSLRRSWSCGTENVNSISQNSEDNMNQKHTEYLYKHFPELFQQRNLSPEQTCMCWGFECGDGWFEILKKLSKKLRDISRKRGIDIRAVQVKEKWGGLRFYIEGGNEEANKAIDEAEYDSFDTCEQCGEPGTMTEKHGWYQTLCDKCEVKHERETFT